MNSFQSNQEFLCCRMCYLCIVLNHAIVHNKERTTTDTDLTSFMCACLRILSLLYNEINIKVSVIIKL